MPPRLHVEWPLQGPGTSFELPPGAARHVQVLRLQPGAPLVLFDGRGGEWQARVEHMGRQSVQVRLETFDAIERELAMPVTIAVGMPANDRMDALVEKACELGVAAIQPLVCERSVLRLAGERAERKVAHWQGVAIAACEQSGRTRVPTVAPVRSLSDWLGGLVMPAEPACVRVVMSLREARPLAAAVTPPPAALVSLSGPEGGLGEAEEDAARARGFVPLSLGARVLRADTAPLALLSFLALNSSSKPRP